MRRAFPIRVSGVGFPDDGLGAAEHFADVAERDHRRQRADVRPHGHQPYRPDTDVRPGDDRYPSSWGVQLPASVTVAPGGSQDFNVGVDAPGQAPGLPPFTVIVRTAGGLSDPAPGTLDIGTAGFFTITPCRLFYTRNAAGPDAAAPGLHRGLGSSRWAAGAHCRRT